MISLDERLQKVAAMVPLGARLADIGCDHGYLSEYLLQNGIVVESQLCDISEPSLDKARMHLEGMENVYFSCGDGAKALLHPVDCVVIAGMGSETIMHIMSEGKEQLGSARLILQPNLDVADLRKYIMDNGYMIVDEAIALSGRRHYVILAIEPGSAEYTDRELICGPVILKNRAEHLDTYAAFRIKVARNALKGAVKGNGERADELKKEINIWEEVLECIQR